jgi:uncharacterized membrane protein
MSERSYRQRLEADLARWQAEGVIPAASADAIRTTFRPASQGVTIATVVGIVGGLLIAAAFLAFVAANWAAITRPARFGILIAGIAGAYGVGAWFDRANRPHLADLCAGVASIIFGAAIALTGQMYHLGDDFAGGMLLWAAGALAAAALTGSRSALAVALVTAGIWSGMRVFELSNVHLPYAGFLLIAALLAVAWNAPAARHLIGLSALVWSVLLGIGMEQARDGNSALAVLVSVSFVLGAGLAFASRFGASVREFGLTLSNYGAFGLGLGVAFVLAGGFVRISTELPHVLIAFGVSAVALAAVGAILARRAGPALAGLSIALALVVASGQVRPVPASEPWVAYALALGSMLCLVVSGMLDDIRPRVVAGWIGMAGTIAAITWAVRGSLLRRAVFLASAGVVAVVLASLLGRFIGKERRQ